MLKKIFIIQFILLALNTPLFAQRNIISLDGEWSFVIDEKQTGIQEGWATKGIKSIANSASVQVPHTWNTTKETAKYHGWAWYEKKISLPQNWKNTNIKIRFDAVFHDATIWINGQKAGEHKSSGYTKFFVEASNLLIAGNQNSIVVLADNSFSAENIPYKHIFDWANDGGIIRSVSLVSTLRPRMDYIHVLAKPDLSSPALGGKGNANIKIKLSEIGQIDASKVDFVVQISEYNQKTQKLIYRKKVKALLNDGIASFDISFDKINRWHFETPNLYKMSVSVSHKNTITDADTVNFGFRELTIQGDKFVFNGETIRTAGVEWMGGSSLKNGMAETKDEIRQSLEKLQYLNTMFTRFHFQQDDYVYDWCDKNGILIQQEIPIWGHKTVLTDTIMGIAKYQLSQTIEDAYNHPSIVAWGVGNEVAARQTINIEGVKELYKFTKSLDNSRLANYVSNTLQMARSWNPGIAKDATSYGDVMMYNDYHTTWYRQARAGRGPMLDSIQAENRKMPLVISEFGLCEPENWGDDSKRIVDMINNYSVYESKSFIAGIIYFCLNDYRTHMGGGKYDFHNIRVHGVYDLEGQAKPSAAILRELNCPIDITALNRNKLNDIAITIVGGLGFPSFRLEGYTCYWSQTAKNYTQGQMYKLLIIQPGKTHGFVMANKFDDKGVISIVNSKGVLIYQKVIKSTSKYG